MFLFLFYFQKYVVHIHLLRNYTHSLTHLLKQHPKNENENENKIKLFTENDSSSDTCCVSHIILLL